MTDIRSAVRGGQQNKDFNAFLDREFPDWKSIPEATETGENGKLKRLSKEYWDKEIEFQKALEKYSRQEFTKGNRVIVEGVQLLDNWFSENDDYYKDKPLIVLSTSLSESRRRQLDRDKSGIKFNSEKEYKAWRKTLSTTMNKFVTNTKVEKGKDYVSQWLNENK